MQITTRQLDGLLELQVSGRLDAYWADHFTTSVLAAVRQGNHRIQVDLSEVEYISSAGLGALMKCFNELKTLAGTFRVSGASKFVVDTLKMTGLDRLLTPSQTDMTGARDDKQTIKPIVIHLPNANMEVYACPSGAATSCRIKGSQPVWRYAQEPRCRRQTFDQSTVSIGLGAPGRDWADCRMRMGEYLSVGGCVAYLPTDSGHVPDYLLAAERFLPELHTLNSLSWQGTFSHLIRFEAVAGSVLSLETLTEQALAVVNADVAGLTMVGEIDGLVGAAWCRSPALAEPDTNPTDYPEVRDWLTFTSERSYSRLSGLVVGVVGRATADKLLPWVRPLGAANGPLGHCHAAAFSYRPLSKGVIDLVTTVRRLFESESPRGLLHLLSDDRPVIGSGQSAFTSGACWVVPISTIDLET